MKKTLFILSSILVLSACSSPTTEESTAPESTVDSSLVDTTATEAPVNDSVVAE